MSKSEDLPLIPAATVLLLRPGQGGGGEGIEVLMVHRNSKLAFGGMWVFPGGRVDEDELDATDPVGSARRAAEREVEEETSLDIDGASLKEWSHWIPPQASSMVTKGPRRRFATWFFATTAPGGEVSIDNGEIRDHRWIGPSEALARHREGEIELAPPTWVTLWQLSQHDSVADALGWAESTPTEVFATRAIAQDPITLVWAGDAAYETGDPETPGPRNRLIANPGNWHYERSPDR